MPKIPKGVVLTEEQQQLVDEIKEARNATKKAGAQVTYLTPVNRQSTFTGVRTWI